MIAAIAVLKKALAEIKKASEKLFQGEITVSKKECWLAGIILVLTGIAVGLVNAPLTHGVNISLLSHNGCNNVNNGPVGSPVGKGMDKLCKPRAGLEESGKEKAADAKDLCKGKKKWISC